MNKVIARVQKRFSKFHDDYITKKFDTNTLAYAKVKVANVFRDKVLDQLLFVYFLFYDKSQFQEFASDMRLAAKFQTSNYDVIKEFEQFNKRYRVAMMFYHFALKDESLSSRQQDRLNKICVTLGVLSRLQKKDSNLIKQLDKINVTKLRIKIKDDVGGLDKWFQKGYDTKTFNAFKFKIPHDLPLKVFESNLFRLKSAVLHFPVLSIKGSAVD